jgi:hypothetical protein
MRGFEDWRIGGWEDVRIGGWEDGRSLVTVVEVTRNSKLETFISTSSHLHITLPSFTG